VGPGEEEFSFGMAESMLFSGVILGESAALDRAIRVGLSLADESREGFELRPPSPWRRIADCTG
jgi:hypothetical protein